jgi:hypothetical protein
MQKLPETRRARSSAGQDGEKRIATDAAWWRHRIFRWWLSAVFTAHASVQG